jgi:pSer/pThr/pTyr-binding forkhead associated (FHA) protein
VGGHVVIGRFDAETGPVDVDLGNLPEATYVSRQHAELIPDGSGQWRVKDLGSRNGVFVRKQSGGAFQRVTGEEPISGGDEIALGNARFEFQVG